MFNKAFILLLYISFGASANLPSYVKVCNRNDPELSKCFQNSMESILPYVKKGIPEMGLPSFDPLHVDKVKFGNLETLSLYGELYDAEVYNITQVSVSNFHVDYPNLNFSVNVHFPYVTFKGNYKLQGKLLLFQLDSDGPFEFRAIDMRTYGQWSATRYTKNNKEYAKFDQYNVKIESVKFETYLGNIFKNNVELSKTVNAAINENADSLLVEFSPLIENILGQVTSSVFNTVNSKYTLDQLYPK